MPASEVAPTRPTRTDSGRASAGSAVAAPPAPAASGVAVAGVSPRATVVAGPPRAASVAADGAGVQAASTSTTASESSKPGRARVPIILVPPAWPQAPTITVRPYPPRAGSGTGWIQ